MIKKIAVVSLGCDKNRVDTENMLYNLSSFNHEIINDYSKANVIIVNTCAFISSAREEAIDTILQMSEYKNIGECEKLIVTGCLSQKYSKELESELLEVDAFMGTNNYDSINEVINNLYKDSNVNNVNNVNKVDKINYLVSDKLKELDNNLNKRVLTTPYHYAYLKIADGCDNFCTFCTIPSIRGKYKSRSIESLVAEAKGLCNNGVKELILVAQDVTRYGQDLYGEYKLIDLLKQLTKLDFKYVRLMYCYPELVTDELLYFIDNTPNMAKYLDIPLQHFDDNILKLMNRKSRQNDIENLIKRIRQCKNYIAIRTTFMVGFPSELDSQFDNLLQFVEKAKIDHVGVFKYSLEADTPSAKIKGRVSEKIKNERLKKLTTKQYENCLYNNQKLVGSVVEVLYEDIDYDRNLFKGRTQYNAPQIDTNVYFSGEFAEVGNYYNIKITKVDGYDLIGEIV